MVHGDGSSSKERRSPAEGGADHTYVEIATEDGAPLLADDFNAYGARSMEARSALQELVEATAFQILIGMVIIANAVIIGMETDNPDYWMFPILEDAFLVTFCFELSMRLWAYGCSVFFSYSNPDLIWNVFDFLIVTLGVLDRAFFLTVAKDSHGGQARFAAMLMRCFRLQRLLRIFRIFRMLKQLYLLAVSFLDAIQSVIWVGVLCILILYICAIMLTRLIGRPDEDDPLADFKMEQFGSIANSMRTLFHIMTFPDLNRFRPLCQDSPGFEAFLITFTVFGAFMIISVLTGVICESMMEKSRLRQEEKFFDRDRARALFVRNARRVFQDHDEAGRGFINRQQFANCKEEVLSFCEQQFMDLTAKDVEAMFELVDYEDTGVIEIEELLYGLVQLSAQIRPMSIMELRRIVVREMNGVKKDVASVDAKLQGIDGRLCELLAAGPRPVSTAPVNGLASLLGSPLPTAGRACFPGGSPSSPSRPFVAASVVVPAAPAPAPTPLPAPPPPGPGLVPACKTAINTAAPAVAAAEATASE